MMINLAKLWQLRGYPGLMELMEDLDPEEARAIVDPALKLMIDSVHHYGGFVVQSTWGI